MSKIRNVMATVISSDIQVILYNFETNTLKVQFHNKSCYAYENVPESVFLGFFNTDSVGKYFHSQIKLKGFKFERVA